LQKADTAEGGLTMNCPKCGSNQVYVVDSRPEQTFFKRRRECMFCGERFSTVEIKAEDYKRLVNIEETLLRLVSK
jgi:transcriptional regulator NrdR family protein